MLAAPIRRALIALCPLLALPVQAQRHPESSGSLPYYSTEPGTPREPDPEGPERPPIDLPPDEPPQPAA